MTEQIESLFPEGLGQRLKTRAVAEALGVCNNTVLNLVKSGVLPAPLCLSCRSYRFDRRAVIAALTARAAGGAT